MAKHAPNCKGKIVNGSNNRHFSKQKIWKRLKEPYIDEALSCLKCGILCDNKVIRS